VQAQEVASAGPEPGQPGCKSAVKRDAMCTAESMCLWKVECKLLHPVHGEAEDVIHIKIDDSEMFAEVLQKHCTEVEKV
jgi:hypothetical protein